MRELPLVSAIDPVFNDSRLHLCLEDLSRQSYPRQQMEVLVVDNGSDRPPDASPYPFVYLLREPKSGS